MQFWVWGFTRVFMEDTTNTRTGGGCAISCSDGIEVVRLQSLTHIDLALLVLLFSPMLVSTRDTAWNGNDTFLTGVTPTLNILHPKWRTKHPAPSTQHPVDSMVAKVSNSINVMGVVSRVRCHGRFSLGVDDLFCNEHSRQVQRSRVRVPV